MLQTILLGLGLSMDAFAVSVSSGICVPGLKPFHALRAAFSFGLFQALMPVAGWLAGNAYRGTALGARVAAYDHWVAFVLLAAIGAKMIKEAVSADGGEAAACDDGDSEAGAAGGTGRDVRSVRTLLLLSFATSVDALAVGLSLSLIGQPIAAPAAAIGAITFAVCAVGFECGKRIGVVLERRAELAGGIVLIGIGAKIVVEHLIKGC